MKPAVPSRETYIIWVRPSPPFRTFPDGWRLRWTFGPLAVLEASSRGWRIIQRSAIGAIAQVLAGVAVGLPILVGVFWYTALAIFSVFGLTLGAELLWFIVVLPLSIGPVFLLAPHIWKCAGWHAHGPFIAVNISSAEIGLFRHHLWVESGGYYVHTQTVAPAWAIRAALRLAAPVTRA